MLEKVEGGMEEAPREGRRVPRDTESEGLEKAGGGFPPNQEPCSTGWRGRKNGVMKSAS